MVTPRMSNAPSQSSSANRRRADLGSLGSSPAGGVALMKKKMAMRVMAPMGTLMRKQRRQPQYAASVNAPPLEITRQHCGQRKRWEKWMAEAY